MEKNEIIRIFLDLNNISVVSFIKNIKNNF